MDATTLNLSF